MKKSSGLKLLAKRKSSNCQDFHFLLALKGKELVSITKRGSARCRVAHFLNAFVSRILHIWNVICIDQMSQCS